MTDGIGAGTLLEMPSATLSNYLWIRKKDVVGTPEEFAPEWQFDVDLSKTSAGRAQKQMVMWLREQAELAGEDPDEAVANVPDKMTVRNWADVGNHWTLSRGDVPRCLKLAKKLGLEVKDERVKAPWPKELDDLKMMMGPRDYQEEAILEWALKGSCFRAPPGYGKTYVILDSIVTKKRCYTLVLTHTDILASQFESRFREGSNGVPLTNCLEVEKDTGKKVIGRYRGKEIFPVTVATWQSFSGKAGKKHLAKLKKSFGRIVVDEAHAFAAPCPTAVIDDFWCEHRDGVSATFNRKDLFQTSLFNVLGPIRVKGVMKEMPVSAYMIKTNSFIPEPKVPAVKQWTLLINAIAKDQERNDQILDWLKFDVEEKRTILVISERVNWCYAMQEKLESEYGIPSKVVQGSLDSKKALKVRKEAEDAINNGEVQVLFATSVFKLGVDIPKLDTMYMPFPMANALNLEQMLGRIRRITPNKLKPVFRYFVDEGAGVFFGCAKATTHHLTKFDGVTVRMIPKHTSAFTAMAKIKEAARQAHLQPEVAVAQKEKEDKKKSGFGKMKTNAADSLDRLFEDLEAQQKMKKTFTRRTS